MTKNIIKMMIAVTLLVGCNNKEKITQVNNSQIEFRNQTMSYIFDFPDTVSVNKQYNGMIIYKNILDTITTHLANPKDSLRDRYITYSMTIAKKILNDENSLKSIVKDTFGAVDNRTIPLFKLKFQHPGIYFIDGFITDNGYLRIHKGDSTRIITNEFRIYHKVVAK
ncbi:hypothetical protein LNQ49_04770 [Flavobacterium sp. F-65]|uniref:Uncharacterized protein n=1 Tax=Flavobacterium pisciphilum TaxID=2893755 RepID=A0ABS8MQ63_9FLAO|nr:hypothetical protein [Flavobacterium sp. F-65]MCC9070909.1 hypothetical protein [Flavobacterium sp. F-65]